MNGGWRALDDFLRTDPGDVGCAEAVEWLLPLWTRHQWPASIWRTIERHFPFALSAR